MPRVSGRAAIVCCGAVLVAAVTVIATKAIDAPAPPPVSTIELEPSDTADPPARRAERRDGKRRTGRNGGRQRGERAGKPSPGRTDDGRNATLKTPAPSAVPPPPGSGPSESSGGFAPRSDDDDDDDPDTNDDPFDDDRNDDSDGPGDD
jgi:hypothetical protein